MPVEDMWQNIWGQEQHLNKTFFITPKRGLIFNEVHYGQNLQIEKRWGKGICNV